MISTLALQVGFLSSLTIVNEGPSLTIVNELIITNYKLINAQVNYVKQKVPFKTK